MGATVHVGGREAKLKRASRATRPRGSWIISAHETSGDKLVQEQAGGDEEDERQHDRKLHGRDLRDSEHAYDRTPVRDCQGLVEQISGRGSESASDPLPQALGPVLSVVPHKCASNGDGNYDPRSQASYGEEPRPVIPRKRAVAREGQIAGLTLRAKHSSDGAW